MKLLSRALLLLLCISFGVSCKKNTDNSKPITIKEEIQNLFPNAQIDSIPSKGHFKNSFRIQYDSPLDPKHPESGSFKHTLYLSHVDVNAPTVLVTDGYASYPRKTELSTLLQSNQVIVEYRMYGSSRPNPIPWTYLTNDNAVEDYHFIVEKLKKIYRGKWLSTGISKGGETTMIYKSKYPDDVDVAVPYVAPLINGVEDPRPNTHINSVGEASCRQRIRDIQRAILRDKKQALLSFHKIATTEKLSFTEVRPAEALEYAVLEFPFSFWQWNGNCTALPQKGATTETLVNFVHEVVGIGFYSDAGYERYLPSFYQHLRELGYYGFDLTPVADLLTEVTSSSNSRFAPKNAALNYNPNYIKKVRDYVEQRGNHILYIYGGLDPWGACAPVPNAQLKALKMVLPTGTHKTRIKDFSPEAQDSIYATLQSWLGKDIKIHPLYKKQTR